MGFTVRATDTASMAGSVSELNKKARGSVTSLKQVGGSLLSLGGKEKKNLARLASAVSGKVEKVGNKAKKTVSSLKLNKDTKDKALDTVTEWGLGAGAGRNQDPGVESDEEEEYGGLGELGDTVIRHPRHQDLLGSRYSHTAAWPRSLIGFTTATITVCRSCAVLFLVPIHSVWECWDCRQHC